MTSKLPDTRNVNSVIPTAHYDALVAKSQENGAPIGFYVRKAIAQFLGLDGQSSAVPRGSRTPSKKKAAAPAKKKPAKKKAAAPKEDLPD